MSPAAFERAAVRMEDAEDPRDLGCMDHGAYDRWASSMRDGLPPRSPVLVFASSAAAVLVFLAAGAMCVTAAIALYGIVKVFFWLTGVVW